MAETQLTVAETPVLLVLENFALAEAGATIAASHYASEALGPENLLSPYFDRMLVTSSIASAIGKGETEMTVTIAFDGPHRVNWLSLHRSNCQVPFRVELFKGDPASTPAAYQSDWLSPIVRAGIGDFTWPDFAWYLGPTPAQVTRWAEDARLDHPVPLPETVAAVRYVRYTFDVSSGSNGGADEIELGFSFAAESFQPVIGALLGWDVSPVSRSTVRRTTGGALLGRRRVAGRRFGFVLEYLEMHELWEKALSDLVLEQGELARVFAWPRPTDRRYFYRQAVLGTVTDLPSAVMARLDWPAARGWVVESSE